LGDFDSWIASNTNKYFLGEVIEVGRFRELN